jgi:uncharacterized protein
MNSGKKPIPIAGLAALLFIASVSIADTGEVAVPPLRSHVTDLTNTLTAAENARLEQKLVSFESRKGSQIAVLIVPTTQPETIEQYSIRVTDAWKLGRKGIDDGILLIVAKRDRAVRIEVGYGLEGVLPDALAKRIVDQVIVPRFRQEDFAGGIDAGVESIIGVIQGEPLPPARARGGSASADQGMGMSPDLIFPLFIALLVFGKLLQSMFGRVAGASLMSMGAGFIGWLIFSSVILGVILAVATFFLSLFGRAGPGIYTGRGGGWPVGGGMGGRGGFGGGGGGFSGGGGGFGGGGASGRW